MKNLVNKLFKKQIMASQAVDYLTIYLKYHINTHNSQYLIFVKSKLRSIVSEKFPDIDELVIKKVINTALQSVAIQANIGKTVTNEVIYLSVC